LVFSVVSSSIFKNNSVAKTFPFQKQNDRQAKGIVQCFSLSFAFFLLCCLLLDGRLKRDDKQSDE